MIIRELNESEIPVIADIERESFSTPWSQESIKSSFDNPANRFYVAESNGIVTAYIGLCVVVDEGYILNIAVKPDYRRGGIGEALLKHIINAYEKDLSFLTLEVRPSNTAALRLYEKFGFAREGIRKNYYRNPVQDALILTKRFAEKEDSKVK